jgi:uncharacterized protein (TIGR02246 family)
VLAIEQIARDYWDAEESGDVERILGHFLPDATWRGPGRTATGHAEIRGFYEEMSAAYPGLTVRIQRVLGTDERACLEWCAAFVDAEGRFHELHGVNIMEGRDGKIASLTAYFDPAELDHVLDAPHAAH